MSALIVLAKAPVAGRVKTRLCPPCTPGQAAALAEAALADTLAAAAGCGAERHVLALAGAPAPWLPHGWKIVPQRGAGLDERLAAAFEDAGAPALLIGMDTPQVTPALLDAGLAALEHPGIDAVLGAARDGGYWAIGLRAREPEAFLGVPMSSRHTGVAQRARLQELGRRVAALPILRDVDYMDDALAVAAQAPATRFAARLGAIAPGALAA